MSFIVSKETLLYSVYVYAIDRQNKIINLIENTSKRKFDNPLNGFKTLYIVKLKCLTFFNILLFKKNFAVLQIGSYLQQIRIIHFLNNTYFLHIGYLHQARLSPRIV